MMSTMITDSLGEVESRYFFTAPWEPIVVRRGDALGLRALADQFADAVAPDLSNRTQDGRWVTILAWCLARSQMVFHASGGRAVDTRAQQHDRYLWMRPLELMWVARTIALADNERGRSLAGQQRVRSWYKDDDQRSDRFGMSVDQFRAYRQTGVYGGYRVAFRKWPGMTVQGDGWTPASVTNKLAKWLDEKLGKGRPSWPLHMAGDDEESISTRSTKLSRGDEHHWWLRQWKNFDQGGRSYDQNTLPRLKLDFRILPEAELLRPVVFGDSHRNGARRLRVVREVVKAAGSNHIDVCRHLGRVLQGEIPDIKLMPLFSRLADAGMDAMDFVAKVMAKNQPRVPLATVAAQAGIKPICKELMYAVEAWKAGASKNRNIRHIESANRFAESVRTRDPMECLRALLQYHETYGGGLRWFVLHNGQIEPRTPPGSVSSRYRFRLWPLCRLATQCGVLRRMPDALGVEEMEETAEASDE